jgi:hypothetical protein
MLSVVAGISPQVDRLNIVLNQYETVPVELARYSNVVSVIPKEDLKDSGKFFPDVSEARYVFLIDDDIGYPSDYVSETIRRFEMLPLRKCIGGYHGSLYVKPPLGQFLRSPRLLFTYKKRIADFRSEGFRFFSELNEATVVDQIGTGTVVLRGEDMPTFEYMRTSIKFVDVRFARWCFEHDIIPVCLPRSNDWMSRMEVDESIYHSFTVRNPSHVCSEILSYAYKVKFRGMPISRVRAR